MVMIEQLITTGKSIIEKLFNYYEDEGLDDETEFFPILKIIISGTADSFKLGSQKKEIEQELIQYSQQLYASFWILQAEEDEKQIDAEYEKMEAIINFNNLYKAISDS